MSRKNSKSVPDLDYLRKKIDDLTAEAGLLKETANGTTPAELDVVLGILQSIDRNKYGRQEWDSYQRANRIFVRVADRGQLLALAAGGRARLYRLDAPNRAIFSETKVDGLVEAIRNDNEAIAPSTRGQVEALLAAIDECGFRYTRDHEIRNGLLSTALICAGILFILALIFTTATGFPGIDRAFTWRIFIIGLWGASGGLANSALNLKSKRVYRNEKGVELTTLFYRGVIGLISAVIITLLIKARLVDFPALRGNSSEMPPELLYVAAFVIGFWDGLFDRILPDLEAKKKPVKEEKSK